MRAAVAVLLLVTAAGAEAAPKSWAIRGARIVTVSGPVIESGTVVVQDGKIAAVGADVAVPAGATVVDGTGRTVYPGLVDGLTTLALTEIGSVAGSVDTTEVGELNPHARVAVALQPHSEHLPVARANGITYALSAPTGGLVSGQSALIRLAGSTPDALVLRSPAALHVVYPSGRPSADAPRSEEPERRSFEERRKERQRNKERALQRLASLLAEARAYAAEPSPAPDARRAALGDAASGKVPVIIRADLEDDIRGAVKFAKDNGLKLVLAGGLEAWRCADVLAGAGVPVLLAVDRLPRREADPYDVVYANPSVLHRAGVRFAIVSDSSSMSRNLPYEAAMAHAFGLPAEVALRAITLSPAEILGVADRVGSLEVGKAGTLVVTTGDVLDHRTQVTHVLIDGEPQSLETRHTRLYEQFRNRP